MYIKGLSSFFGVTNVPPALFLLVNKDLLQVNSTVTETEYKDIYVLR